MYNVFNSANGKEAEPVPHHLTFSKPESDENYAASQHWLEKAKCGIYVCS
jgi:hypothetical protein